MKKAVAAVVGCGLFGVLAGPVPAAVLWETIPDLTESGYSEYCSPCGGSGRVFDAFSLTAASTLDGAAFTVGSWYNWPSDVTIGFFADAGGQPGSALASFAFTPAALSSMVDTPYGTTVVTADFADFDLAAGNYFFSVVGADDLAIPSYLKPGAGLFAAGDGFHDGETTGFRLTGGPALGGSGGSGGSSNSGSGGGAVIAVPEPEVWGLMIAGFGIVGGALRRRREEARHIVC